MVLKVVLWPDVRITVSVSGLDLSDQERQVSAHTQSFSK